MTIVPSLQPEGGLNLALAVVASSSAPLLLLDGDLTVIAASASFYREFQIEPVKGPNRQLSALGNGEWNVRQLSSLLDATAAGTANIQAYEMDLNREGQGSRRLVLNAQKLAYGDADHVRLLLSVSDVTDARLAERFKDDLLREKAILLQEVQHRVANSLQIIASILLRKARTAQSDETRMHLRDAHLRLMSVGAIQQQLLGSGHGDPVYIGPYLSGLSQALAALMTDNSRLISLNVQAEDGTASSAEAVSIGLIVAELVINAFKHVFVGDEASGLVVVAYEAAETSWQLTVSDNGIGMPEGQLDSDKPRPGLGTIIVAALAKQLDARVEVMRNRGGTTVSITHGTLDRTRLPLPLAGAETRLAPKSNGNSIAAG